MTTLFRYIFMRFARNILGVFLLVVTLILLVDFVEHLRRASDKEGIETASIAMMVFLHTPSLAEQIFPFAVLFGSMASLLQLSRTMELAVARSAGVSVWQLVAPGIVFSLLLGVFATTVYSPLAAEMRAAYDRMNADIFGGRSSFMDTKRSGSWLRQRGIDGEAVIHAESAADQGVRLSTVTAYIFNDDDELIERVDARSAQLRPGRWDLADARVTRPGAGTSSFSNYVISTNLAPEQVREIFGSTQSIGFWSLPAMIDASEAAGLSAQRFKMQFQILLVQPLTFAAMVLVAATVSMKIFRFGNLIRMILTGVTAGFMLYVLTQVISDLGYSGAAPPAFASWLPAAFAMLLSLTILLYQEDG